MDGVLVDIASSWVFIHDRFGVNNEHSLRAYLNGEIDDQEFIRRDIELWKEKDPDISAKSLQSILAEAPLMNGAKETIAKLKAAGCATAIVSAGIDLLSERVADELGMDIHFANGLETDSAGRLSGEGILRVRLMEKGEKVREIAERFGVTKDETVSVGNSRYDVPMFEQSALGIAFRPEDDCVRNGADVIIEEKDLTAILDYIDLSRP